MEPLKSNHMAENFWMFSTLNKRFEHVKEKLMIKKCLIKFEI